MMSGSRPLTAHEERALVRRIRRINPRDRALITCQLFSGFRISEILALTIGHVLHGGTVRDKMGLPPRFLKGHYGHTRWVPICLELRRALEAYLSRRARHVELMPDAALFLSREHDDAGGAKSLCRSAAEKMTKGHLLAVAEGDPQGLSTHSLRKTRARRLYDKSGHDILLVRDGLGHANVAVTQKYLATDRDRLSELILQGDWTRRPRTMIQPVLPMAPERNAPAPAFRSSSRSAAPALAATTAWLPGFEVSAAA